MSETQQKLSLAKQSAWLMSAKVIGFVLSFLLPLLTVRFLTLGEVGVYRQAFLVIGSAIALLPLGFSMSAFYFLSRNKENRASTILNILLFNFVAGGAACFTLSLYPQLLGNVFQNDEIVKLAPLIGIAIWLGIFSAFLEVAPLANQETRLATLFIITTEFLKTALMAGAVVFFATVEAFLYAAILHAVIQTITLFGYLISRFPNFWKSFDRKFFREQIIYTLPFGLAGVLFTIQTNLPSYFVGYRFSQAEYAIYAYGSFELPLITMLYESFSAVMIPRMSELQSQGKKREMLLMTIGVMQKLAFVYLPLCAFLMVVADKFIITLFTKNFQESVPIFQLNLLIFPFYCLILDPVGRAFKEVGSFLLKARIVLLFLLFAGLWFGIQHFNLPGVIMIVVVFAWFERIMPVPKIFKVLEVKREDFYLLKNVGKTAIAAILAGSILAVFYWFSEEVLFNICVHFSRQVLNLISFEQASEFFGGSLFLGICFLVFAPVYLFLANRFGAIEKEYSEKLIDTFKKILRKIGLKMKGQKSKTGETLPTIE
jgi:O-antigen/teichoic acid export membrane protein